jgi:hypothetical protein
MGQGELTDITRSGPWETPTIGIITAYHYDYAHDSPANRRFCRGLTMATNASAIRISIRLAAMTGMHLIYEA